MCCIESLRRLPRPPRPVKETRFSPTFRASSWRSKPRIACRSCWLTQKRRAVAAIHSGWRGTLLRIAAKALGRMRMEFGTSPQDVIAAIGPSIGRCCYEVGSEVAAAFHSQFPNAREWFDGPFETLAAGENDPNWLPWLTMKPPGHAPPAPRVHLDLDAANRAILAEAGVPPAHRFSNRDFAPSAVGISFSAIGVNVLRAASWP